MDLGNKPLHMASRDERLLDAARKDKAACGWIDMPDGRHIVAARDLPDLHIQVIAHQRESAMVQVLQPLSTSIGSTGGVVALLMTLVTAGLTIVIVWRYEHALTELNRGLERTVERRSRALMKTRDAVIFGLAHLAETRHDSTGEHLVRIGQYVEVLARQVALHDPAMTEQVIHTIAVASSLHDIGKVAMPDEVLLKKGKLTPRQRATMREHTTIGGACLQAIEQRLGSDDFLAAARQIALTHHERWNGTGYPGKLKGDQIPLSGRIVALADVYDALTSEREYKCAIPHDKTREIIVKASGKQFDPMIVEAFLAVEREFIRIADLAHQPRRLRAAA
jgi:response regulator RpfG family c-di-GMP phosphodiesterase